jgi:hypothetical protein
MADAAAALNCAGGILTAPAFWEQLQSEAAVLTKASDAGGKGLVLLVTRFLLAPSVSWLPRPAARAAIRSKRANMLNGVACRNHGHIAELVDPV